VLYFFGLCVFPRATVLCDFLYFSLNSPTLKASMFSGIARCNISVLAIIKMLLLRGAAGGKKRRVTAKKEEQNRCDGRKMGIERAWKEVAREDRNAEGVGLPRFNSVNPRLCIYRS